MLVRRHASRVVLYVAALAVTMLITSGAFAEQAVTVLYAGSYYTPVLWSASWSGASAPHSTNRLAMSFGVMRAAPRNWRRRLKKALSKAMSLSAPIRK